MGANVLILGRNLPYGFDSCPAFGAWPVERNRVGKFANMEKAANELHAGRSDLADWAATKGAGLLPGPDEAVASVLWTVSVQPTFVRRFGRVAA